MRDQFDKDRMVHTDYAQVILPQVRDFLLHRRAAGMPWLRNFTTLKVLVKRGSWPRVCEVMEGNTEGSLLIDGVDVTVAMWHGLVDG